MSSMILKVHHIHVHPICTLQRHVAACFNDSKRICCVTKHTISSCLSRRPSNEAPSIANIVNLLPIYVFHSEPKKFVKYKVFLVGLQSHGVPEEIISGGLSLSQLVDHIRNTADGIFVGRCVSSSSLRPWLYESHSNEIALELIHGTRTTYKSNCLLLLQATAIS